MSRLRFGNKTIDLPRNRVVRIGIGVLLVLGGLVGFLPILGFWMVPLGFIVLALDFPFIRRINRRVSVFVLRMWAQFRARFGQRSAGSAPRLAADPLPTRTRLDDGPEPPARSPAMERD